MNLRMLSGVLMGAFLLSIVVQAGSQQSEEKAAATKAADKEKKTQARGDAAKGKAVFAASCEVCHDAASEAPKVGPGLKGLYKRPPHKLSDGQEHRHTEAAIRELVQKGTRAMPPMGEVLSPQELDNVLAYMQTL